MRGKKAITKCLENLKEEVIRWESPEEEERVVGRIKN
jgi:hypothetical protein